MFAFFTPIPNWNYASPLELIVWVIAMSLAALFGVWCFFVFSQDRLSSEGQEFRGVFLFAAAIAMFIAAIVVASRGHTTASNEHIRSVGPERVVQPEKDRVRVTP
jgi:hypothetical protein